jgi:hypothetical protein
MVVFGLQADKVSNEFMRFHELQNKREDVLRLFKLDVKEYPGYLWVVRYEPLLLNPAWIGAGLLLIGSVFDFFPAWFLVTAGLFFLAGFFCTKYFYRVMVFLGQNKHKNDGRIVLLSEQETLLRLNGWQEKQ